MKRREFIAALGGAAAAWPLARRARKQRPSACARIGVLLDRCESATNRSMARSARGVPRRPARAWATIEGQNMQFEFRSADGNAQSASRVGDELVRAQASTSSSRRKHQPSSRQGRRQRRFRSSWRRRAIRSATGLISSLARPGGNITGLSGTSAELGAKTLELIRDVLPSTRRVAVLANASDPFSRPFVEQIEQGGRALGIAIQTIMVRGVEEFAAAFAAHGQGAGGCRHGAGEFPAQSRSRPGV